MKPRGANRPAWCAATALRIGAVLLALTAAAALDPAAVRAGSAVTKREAKVAKVLIEPGGYEKVVVLVSDRREYKYYRFSPPAPLTLEITGPTTLSVMVRLLFDQTMKGTQDFTLRVEEGGLLGSFTQIGVHNLKAHKSTVASLKDVKDLVPSKAETLDIVVPGGKHSYRILLGAGPKAVAIARVQIPKKDLVAGAEKTGGSR